MLKSLMQRVGAGRARAAIGMAVCALLAAIYPLANAFADDVSVPIELQVDLLGRVAKFERTFGLKGTTPAKVVVVSKAGSTASTRASAQLMTALGRAAKFAGRPLTTVSHAFSNAETLKRAAAGAAIVYLTPGLSAEMKSIAASLSGSQIIVVASSNGDVERGAVLGFELQSARPRIVVNLAQARAQKLDFNSQLLRLAKVVQ